MSPTYTSVRSTHTRTHTQMISHMHQNNCTTVSLYKIENDFACRVHIIHMQVLIFIMLNSTHRGSMPEAWVG